MIQNDIDLLDEDTSKDPYYFALRLLSLKKNTKKTYKNKKNTHFKFLIEQENYIIDQTTNKIQNIFWIMKTSSISINKQTLHFFISDLNQTHTQFELKMYLISHEAVQQLASMSINTLTYIEVLIQFGKNIFRQSVSLCLQYTLQYEIYIDKSKLAVQNLLKNNYEQNQELKNAFKKKTHEVIEVQNEKAQIKHKNTSCKQTRTLRKSLYFNMNKLLQVKKRNQQLKQKALQKSISSNSFFSKFGDVFKSKPNQNSSQKINSLHQPKQNLNFSNNEQKIDSERSCTIVSPAIDFQKHKRPQKKFSYHASNVQKEKESQIVKIHQNINNNNSQIKISILNPYFRMLKCILFISCLALVVYYLACTNKKGKYKFFRNLDWLNS